MRLTVFALSSTGDGQDTESPASLRLPPRACAVGLRQRPDGHEKGVLCRRLQKSGGLPQREVRRDVQSSAFLWSTPSRLCSYHSGEATFSTGKHTASLS